MCSGEISDEVDIDQRSSCLIQIRYNLLAVILVVAGSGPAYAQSVGDIGVSATLVGTDLVDPVMWGANKTIRVWAELPSGWRLDAVAGNAASPMSIEVAGGSFYQDAFGGPTSRSMNPVLFSLAPSLEWDSFLTIGALTSVDNELSQIGMDWTDFEAGNSLAINNGSVFVVPTEPQGELQTFTGSCGQARSGVLIGQFTLLGEGASLMCSVLLQGKDESGAVWQQPIVDVLIDQDGHSNFAATIACAADSDQSGVVDVLDLLWLLETWSETGCADISGDAIVGVDDLVLLIEAWGICVVE
jgi:hypothetical protein